MPQVRVGVVWDRPILFTRLLEDCGHLCELITPHLLAAPFFKRAYHGIIIPAGFAHPEYSRVLPALRALEDRFHQYILSGGTVLVFGAGMDLNDAYDWLPMSIGYRYGFANTDIINNNGNPLACILQGDIGKVTVDGTLECEEGVFVPLAEIGHLLLECPFGAGKVIISTIHEYPTQEFLKLIMTNRNETFL